MFAKFAKLDVTALVHDTPRYHLAESDRATSPAYINMGALERSAFNREHAVVALPRAHRSFGRINCFSAHYFTGAARSFTICHVPCTADKQHAFPTGHADDDPHTRT